MIARRYAAVALTAARLDASERAALVGRLGFYAVILLIFSRLWEVVLERGALEGAGATELVWYLALTEWVMLSLPPLHLDIERDLRTGDVAYQLPRPISYLGARLADGAGRFAVRALWLGVGGLSLALVFADGPPSDPRGLLLAPPLVLLAGAVALGFLALIGLCALWLQDASPLFWMWQKAAFILGGLMLPLSIYPEWLRTLAEWTPFPALLYGVGRQALGFDPAAAALVAGKLALWGAIVAGLLLLTWRRGLRALEVNGG